MGAAASGGPGRASAGARPDAVGTGAAHAGPAVGVQAAEQLLVLAHEPAGFFGVRGGMT